MRETSSVARPWLVSMSVHVFPRANHQACGTEWRLLLSDPTRRVRQRPRKLGEIRWRRGISRSMPRTLTSRCDGDDIECTNKSDKPEQLESLHKLPFLLQSLYEVSGSGRQYHEHHTCNGGPHSCLWDMECERTSSCVALVMNSQGKN